jgi:hypothetical protein
LGAEFCTFRQIVSEGTSRADQDLPLAVNKDHAKGIDDADRLNHMLAEACEIARSQGGRRCQDLQIFDHVLNAKFNRSSHEIAPVCKITLRVLV